MDAKDLPSTTCPEYRAAQPSIELIRDLLAGTPRMHERYETYIPKWQCEAPADYAKRAKAAKVYGGLGRSLSACVGKLFAKDPERAKWPEAFEGHWWNIDGKGTLGDVFAKRRAEDAIADGFGAILVDFPRPPEGVVVTAAAEVALNLRPFWAAYQRLDILNWRIEIINNVTTLTRVTLRESEQRPDGTYGTKTVPVYRVLRLLPVGPAVPGAPLKWAATWQLLEEIKTTGGIVSEVKVIGSGTFTDAAGKPFDVIPLAVGYAGRTDAPLTAAPPLLDLAWCNLQHWRIATDKRYYEQVCAYPQPVLKGDLVTVPTVPAVQGKPVAAQLPLGPGTVVRLRGADSDFFWREMEGKSLEKLNEAMQAERDEMGELGASFLAKKTRGVETAEAKHIDAVAENATLATAGVGIEDWFNQALEFHARFLGISKERAPTIALNKDFEEYQLDAATMTAYVAAWKEGLPTRVFLEAWQKGGRIPADADLDALEGEMMANAAAIADERARAAEDRAAAMKKAA